METVVRTIVSDLGINVATKKLVCKKFCEQFGQSALSPTQKKKIHKILNCIIDELVANSNAGLKKKKPETPICKVDVDSDQDEDVKENNDRSIEREETYSYTEKNPSTTSPDSAIWENDSLPPNLLGYDNVKENPRVDNLENIESNRTKEKSSFHRRRLKRLSSDRDSLGEWNQNDDITWKKSPPKSKLKRCFNRLATKDVMNLIMDSDDNADVSSETEMSSPCATPKKRMNNRDSPLVQRNQLSKKRRVLCISDSDDSETEVDDSKSGNTSDPQNQSKKNACFDGMSEDSDNDFADIRLIESNDEKDEMSSPCATPKKRMNIRDTLRESPLVKRNQLSKKRRVSCISDSDDSKTEVDDSKSGNTSDSDPQNQQSKKNACFDGMSEDSDNDFAEIKLVESNYEKDDNDTDDENTHNREVLESKPNDEKYDDKSTRNTKVLESCKVVLIDCCAASHVDQSDNKVKSKFINKKVDNNNSSDNRPRKERKTSCSSLSSLSDDSDVESSLGTERVSPLSLPCSKASSKRSQSGVKRKRKEKSEKIEPKKKSQNKTLKGLRAICRHIGLVLRNTIELKGCYTDEEKASRIKELLHEKGMVGRPSMKSAEQYNLERELRELGGVNNDSDSSPGKGKKKTAKEIWCFS